ncbi:MAG: glycyl-radical enzyme activating protein [Clostridiales bacterium]|nr:glycyl-radical enzyme activating protein [Clostridiales bacterium]
MRLPVTNIQRFSTQDGPGIRTTVFLRGCPLSCKWCHNPETQSFHQQILYTEQYCIACGACVETCPVNAHYLNTDNVHCYDSSKCIGCLACSRVCPSNAIEPASRDMSTDEIMETVLSDKVFYGDKGGITLSGREPLFHMEGCISLLESSKKANITTVIDTSGYFNESKIDELIHLTDLFLWDYKDGNSQRHLNYTGVHNQKILDTLFLAES